MKRYSHDRAITKRNKIPQKKQKMLVHIVESSTAVVKVDIKVINVSLTKSQFLQCVPLASTHAEIPLPRDATELNSDGVIKLNEVHY